MKATRRFWGKKFVWPAVVAVTALPFLYVSISVYSAHVLTSPTNWPSPIHPDLLGVAEPWSTRTEDGLTLRGWYLPSDSRKSLVICVHGMHDNWSRVADVGVGLRERGHPVLLFDLRGHGQSDPARLTMGRAERADLRAVLAWARRAGFPPERIGWLGQSMGASTILLEGLDNQEIRCAVLDSPYGDLPQLLNVQLTLHSGLPSIFNPGILLAAHRAYGVRTDDLVPQRLASRWGDRPLLLIHGEKDTIVPVEQGRAIARAVGPACELITLPGVEHIEGFQSQPELYLDAVDRFFRRALPGSPPDQPAQPLPMTG